jgi:GntR family transcriptional regulator
MGTVTDPVYLRVLEDLRAQIRDGVLAPGARVPSRNGIIARYGVGETAAKHALAVLAAEGLIEPRAGSGSYVRAVPAPCYLEHDRPHFPGSPFGLADGRPAPARPAEAGPPPGHAAGHGRAGANGQAGGNGQAGEWPGRSAVVSWEHQTQRVPAPRHIARKLRLPADTPVTRTRYLLTADGTPVQLAVSYEPVSLATGTAPRGTAPRETGAATAVPPPEEGPFAGRGVIERMRAIGVTVDQVVEEISVRGCLREEAACLGIPAGATVFAVGREHRAGDRVVEAAEIVAAADRFRLRYRIPVTGPFAIAPAGGPA